MSKIISLITILLAAITFFSCSNEIKAEDNYDKNIPADTNIGYYIYEDKEYLTQKQVDKINAMNKKLNNDENITLVIVDHIPIQDYSGVTYSSLTDEDQRKYYFSTLIDKFKHADYERESFDDDKFFSDLSMGRNFILLSLKDKKVYWEPSSDTNRYLTDYKFWKLKFWLEPALHSFDRQHQIDAVLELTEKLGQEVKPFATGYPDKESASFEDINQKVNGVKFFFKAFFLLLIFAGVLSLIFALIFSTTSLKTILFLTMFDRDK